MAALLTTAAHSVDSGVAWETLVGATALLAGVVLTGLWTDRRQERQIAAEHDRFEGQLQHDRELTDLAELRSLLDTAAEDLSQLEQRAIRVLVVQEGPASQDRAFAQKRLDDAGNAFAEALGGTKGMTDRMALRIGWEHELVSKHQDAASALNRGITERAGVGLVADSPEIREQHEALRQFQDDIYAFVDAARRFVASQLPMQAS
jgi:hypothetical protein